MSSSHSESSSGGSSLCCSQHITKIFSATEEKRYRSFVRTHNGSRKVRFVGCWLAFTWVCQALLLNSFIFHEETQPTPPRNFTHDHMLYAVLSCVWVLHLPVLAFIPTECTMPRSLLSISMYFCTIVYIVVVQVIMGLDGELVHDVWVTMALCGCLSFTFKQMIPIFIFSMLGRLITITLQTTPYILLNCSMYLVVINLCWEREKKLRFFMKHENVKIGVLKSQQHAIHDVRNMLQEVLAIVEMESNSPSEASTETSENMEFALGELKVKTTGTAAANTTNSRNTFPSDSVSISILKETSKSDAVRRVREEISRMTERLETSLRDGRNTAMDETCRLVPVIYPCNLGKLIFEDYICDPLVVVNLSPDFPKLCETDSEWIKIVVINLVSNAKKHGPSGCVVEVKLCWCSEASTIHIAVTDQGVGISPARSRDIWSGDETSGRIGIGAIRSYIDGLGGTYGNDGPIFWFHVPGGMTHSAFTMSPWTLRFASKKAEQKFVEIGHQPSTTITTVVIVYVLYFFFIFSYFFFKWQADPTGGRIKH